MWGKMLRKTAVKKKNPEAKNRKSKWWIRDKQNIFKFQIRLSQQLQECLIKLLKRKDFFQIFLTETEETRCLEHL